MNIVVYGSDDKFLLYLYNLINGHFSKFSIIDKIICTYDSNIVKKYMQLPDTSVYILNIGEDSTISGKKLGETISNHNKQSYIIYISSYSVFSPEFITDNRIAFDYVSREEGNFNAILINSVNNFLNFYLNKNINNSETVVINSKKIKIDDICYIETIKGSPHKICIHFEESKIELRSSLKNIYKKLNKYFLMTHQSNIVNLKKIKEIDFKNRIAHLSAGRCLCSRDFISRYKKGEFDRFIKTF